MAKTQSLEVPIAGMDCAECTQHVRRAIAALPGVESVNVFLASEKAVVKLDPTLVDLPAIRRAVHGAGYRVPASADSPAAPLNSFTHRILTLFGIVFAAVLFIVVVGEWFGLFEQLTERVPFPIGLGIVLVAGCPIFQ